MQEQGNTEELENCGYHALLNKYGPNYERLKKKIGHLRDVFIE